MADESNLVIFARRELELRGDDQKTIEGFLRVVQAFADMGHSGGSAAFAIPTIERLLSYQPLTALTNDPEDWNLVAEELAGEASLYQCRRNPEAFSHDGGNTYYLLSECGPAGAKKMRASIRGV